MGKRGFWIAGMAVGALLLIAASFQFDAAVREAIVASQGSDWRDSAQHRFVGTVSRYGDWPQLMLVGAVALVIAWKCRSREWTRLVATAMLASTLAGILANASRLTTGRTRPRESPRIEQGWYGPWHEGRLLVGDSRYNAYPSGHTATAVGFAAPILFAKPLVGVPLFAAAGTIAWSRMALGAHHLSDVVTSVLLALATGWFCLVFVRTRGDAVVAAVVVQYRAWRESRR